MTEELKKIIDAELDEALQSGDQTRMLHAQIRYFKAMMDCQMKTATRVKGLVESMDEIKQRIADIEKENEQQNKDIASLKATQREVVIARERAKGAAMLAAAVKAFLAGGGLAIVYKLMEAFSK